LLGADSPEDEPDEPADEPDPLELESLELFDARESLL
jgi:hypothetical protein